MGCVMTSNPLENVVADREKFSLRLGPPSGFFDKVGMPAATGGACAAIAALVAAHVAVPATVVKILGITIYASSGPVGWVAGAAAVAAFGAGCSAHVLGREMSDRFGGTGTYRKEFDGNLSEIGRLVADIVFRPMAALAMPDWSEDRRDYILRQFDRWGYDREWARCYLQNLWSGDGDIMAPVREVVTCKGFGRRDIKDRTIAKQHLIGLAIRNLEAAASDFGGGQEIFRREDEIRRQLKRSHAQ